MGILRIRGTIDLGQFWPDGESDADTTKLLVAVDYDSIAFAEDGVTFVTTHIYEGAVSRGTGSNLVIKKGKVTVRLQGIDAPELHYRAGALPKNPPVTDAKRKKFNALNAKLRRQHWGETATVALAKYLREFAVDGKVQCEAISAIEAPGDLVDTYGRAVANIRVGVGFNRDINTWRAHEGWAFPTFYSSMTNDEIQVLLDAAKHAMPLKRIWPKLSGDASKFDDALMFRGTAVEPAPGADKGPLLMPKVFRRQVAWQLQKRAGITKAGFERYLSAHPDECIALEDFLKNGVHSSKTRYLHQFVKGNKFLKKPQDIVFKESASTLVDKNGKKIESF